MTSVKRKSKLKASGNIAELENLFKLLDDEDENIYANVRDRFVSLGQDSFEFLRLYLNDESDLIRKRANEIISIINFENVLDKFRLLFLNERTDILEEGIFNIASFAYPDVNMKDYEKLIDKMAADIRKKFLNNGGGAVEKLNAVNNFLFFENKFRGNSENYYDEENSYINRVLDSRLGNPITLSILYLLISRRLELPVFGINLPGHFILKYSQDDEEFFIDPFNKGVLISMNEAKQFVKKIGMSAIDFDKIPYLKITSDKEILLRVLRNLIEIYNKKSETIKSEQLERLMSQIV